MGRHRGRPSPEIKNRRLGDPALPSSAVDQHQFTTPTERTPSYGGSEFAVPISTFGVRVLTPVC